MFIIVPAYEPDEKLVAVVKDIKENLEATIVVVNDGSAASYDPYYEEAALLGATVLTHEVNRGKGAALKTAFAYISEHAEPGEAIVTVDSDGQHLIGDIVKVANRVAAESDAIVLGARAFVGKVPARSRFGNKVTAFLFKLATGQPVTDTQTGLRGFSSQILPWLLQLDGERFEYEFNMLLEAKGASYSLVEEAIETVYLEENKSSHFRPIQDSLRIYAPFIKFMASSGACALLDMVLLFILMALTKNLLFSVIVSRLLSSTSQYLLNAKVVFKQEKTAMSSMIRYALLVLAVLTCNYLLIQGLVGLGLGLVLAKLITEIFLFIVSYRVQQNLVFA